MRCFSESVSDANYDNRPDDTQVCSCHNVSKGDISAAVKSGTCKTVLEIKSCTKAGAGCGGCMPLVTQIFNAEMKAMGAEVKNHLCPHFEYSRVDLFNIISVRQLKTMDEVMREVGKNPESLGCELCKPTLASIFASLWNRHVMVSTRWMMGGDARVAVRDRDRVKLTFLWR
jgi:nitrite reductase (NAD(P)H)